jgi:hypothetical protein
MTGIASTLKRSCGCIVYTPDEGQPTLERCGTSRCVSPAPVEVRPGPPHAGLHARAVRAESEHAAALLEIERLSKALEASEIAREKSADALLDAAVKLSEANERAHDYHRRAQSLEGVTEHLAKLHDGFAISLRYLNNKAHSWRSMWKERYRDAVKQLIDGGVSDYCDDNPRWKEGRLHVLVARVLSELQQLRAQRLDHACQDHPDYEEASKRSTATCSAGTTMASMRTRAALAAAAAAAFLQERATLRIQLSDATNRAAIAEADAASLREAMAKQQGLMR